MSFYCMLLSKFVTDGRPLDIKQLLENTISVDKLHHKTTKEVCEPVYEQRGSKMFLTTASVNSKFKKAEKTSNMPK